MLNDLQNTRAFIQIVDSGSIAAAARVLGEPANTVGRMIQRLESEVGCNLLLRSTRKISLTDEGRIFYEKALELLEFARQAEESIRPRKGKLFGTLRLAVRTTTIQFGVVEDLVQFITENSEVRIQLLVSDEPIDVIENGLDLSLRIGELPDSTLKMKSIGNVHFGLAASPQYVKKHGFPKEPEELKHHSCVRAYLRKPQRSWSLVGPRGKKVEAAIDGPFESNDVRAQSSAIYAGLGIGLRPQGEIKEFVQKKKLVPILPGWQLHPINVQLLMPPKQLSSSKLLLIESVVPLFIKAIQRMNGD